MVHPQDGDNAQNYEQFRDVLSTALIERISKPQARPRRRAKPSRKNSQVETTTEGDNSSSSSAQEPTDAEELSEFVDYLASEIFSSLPEELQGLEHYIWAASTDLQERYSPLPLETEFVSSKVLQNLDPSIPESLVAYGIVESVPLATSADAHAGAATLLAPVVSAYLASVTAAPPPPISTKALATGCELCGRDWINLSYHHLIPRKVHAKVVKRGWHRPDELQNVAWICGACHRFVHRFANHEDLARYYYTVELLLQQPEIVAFTDFVGRLRWKGASTRSRWQHP